ncbi:MAG: hypothetical protein KDA31_14010 [Phycisphaerales bacterium]|nr:hypothetical protein [Phycisphaerales bacterium]MCB9836388.1 hypothetical protein [Phycisphaera sp.]
MDSDAKIGEIIEACRPLLSKEALNGIDHWFSHDEWEIAFEGLVLHLIEADVVPPYFDFDEWCALGREIGLDKDSVIDGEFWTKFVTWGRAKCH